MFTNKQMLLGNEMCKYKILTGLMWNDVFVFAWALYLTIQNKWKDKIVLGNEQKKWKTWFNFKTIMAISF